MTLYNYIYNTTLITTNCDLCIVDNVRANNVIWLVGDNFLNDSVSVLRQIQFERRDFLHLYAEYDVKAYFPKKLDTTIFGKQIRDQLCTALSDYDRLPTVIIIVLGNNPVDHLVSTPTQTKRIWDIVFTEIDRVIRTRKDQLNKKCYYNDQPRIYINNMFPRFKDDCENTGTTHESFKTKRRRFNHLLPQIARRFNIGVLPITGIIPDEKEFFLGTNGTLSGKGINAFWHCLSREFKIQEQAQFEGDKTKIIHEYLEQKKEVQRLESQRGRFESQRSKLKSVTSTPVSKKRNNSRWDRNNRDVNRGRHTNRSQSATR